MAKFECRANELLNIAFSATHRYYSVHKHTPEDVKRIYHYILRRESKPEHPE